MIGGVNIVEYLLLSCLIMSLSVNISKKKANPTYHPSPFKHRTRTRSGCTLAFICCFPKTICTIWITRWLIGTLHTADRHFLRAMICRTTRVHTVLRDDPLPFVMTMPTLCVRRPVTLASRDECVPFITGRRWGWWFRISHDLTLDKIEKWILRNGLYVVSQNVL